MILLAYVIGLLSLAAGTGLVIVALLRLETREREGFVSKGWRMRHAPPAMRENESGRILAFRGMK